MKAKLKFDRNEMKGFLALVRNLSVMVTDESFMGMMFKDAVSDLFLKIMMRIPKMKGSSSITLTEIETLALKMLLSDCVDKMMPYEQAIGYGILEKLDKLHQEHNRLKRINTENPKF